MHGILEKCPIVSVEVSVLDSFREKRSTCTSVINSLALHESIAPVASTLIPGGLVASSPGSTLSGVF